MPIPKLFGGSSSKPNASENGSHTNTPANDKQFVPQTPTATSGVAVSEYSDSVMDAWAATNRVLPQAKGTEKILNKIGELVHHCQRPFIIQS